MKDKYYIKKPIKVRAFQWMGEEREEDFPEWLRGSAHDNIFVDYSPYTNEEGASHVIVYTPEGKMRGSKGDYIVEDVEGNFYPCKQSVFEATYAEAKP